MGAQEAGASGASLPARRISLCFLTSAAAHGFKIGLSTLPIGTRSLPDTFTSERGPIPGNGGAKSKALPVRIHGPETSGTATRLSKRSPAPVRAKTQTTPATSVPAGRKIAPHGLVLREPGIGFLRCGRDFSLSWPEENTLGYTGGRA